MSAIKWLNGQYKDVTEKEKALDGRILVSRFKRGSQLKSPGVLAGYVYLRADDEEFQSSLARLSTAGLIEIEPGAHYNSKWITITGSGELIAGELIGKAYIEEQDAKTAAYKANIRRLQDEANGVTTTVVAPRAAAGGGKSATKKLRSTTE